MLISSVLLVQPDEGVSVLVVDRIGDNLPQSTEKSRGLVIKAAARLLLVQPDEGVSVLVVDRIGDNLPQSTEKSRVLVIKVGARHKCQQAQKPPLLSSPSAAAAAAAARCRRKFVSGQLDEENPFVLISSALLVQPDEGVSVLVVDQIGDNLPQSTEKSRVLVIPVGARHKCQQDALLSQIQQMLCFRKFSRCFAFANSAVASSFKIQQIHFILKFSRCVGSIKLVAAGCSDWL
ncbi:hypothetical protein F511_27801 [Dorcoceras hygrometricum]|uniref:Uncharacterized protein n=1 Tax=Dorcoceras hygrometricum TaxID=472368 RepID=A0A2Z7CW83_9LAMI|nr:hypothetical protein F511_27801 [Dorcoceras hygrometricum]